MRREIGRWTAVATLAGLATFGLATGAWAACEGNGLSGDGQFDFDFSGTQYADCFRDLVRGAGINSGVDLAHTGHTALNITGSFGSGGATWLTVVDKAPSTAGAEIGEDNKYGSQGVCADILIERFNNRKGTGLVALLNEGAGQMGLALILFDAGNSDSLVLATVDPNQAGKLVWLTSVRLKSLIKENQWYRLVFLLAIDDPSNLLIQGQVFGHDDPSDPNSDIFQIGSTLTYSGERIGQGDTPASLPAGVSNLGESGIIGQATSAAVNSSVTNFTNIVANCFAGGSGPP